MADLFIIPLAISLMFVCGIFMWVLVSIYFM